jgi:hypothetical protein
MLFGDGLFGQLLVTRETHCHDEGGSRDKRYQQQRPFDQEIVDSVKQLCRPKVGREELKKSDASALACAEDHRRQRRPMFDSSTPCHS